MTAPPPPPGVLTVRTRALPSSHRGEAAGDALGVALAVDDGDIVVVADPDGDAVEDGEPVDDGDILGEPLPVVVALGLAEADAEADSVGKT